MHFDHAAQLSRRSFLDGCFSLGLTSAFLYSGSSGAFALSGATDAVIPNDHLWDKQWHLRHVGVPEAWNILRETNQRRILPGESSDLTFGSTDITIAIFDDGIPSRVSNGRIKPKHPDFDVNLTDGMPKVPTFFDFVEMRSDNEAVFIRDAATAHHGLGVAGIAAGAAGNRSPVTGVSEGLAGVAANCRLIAVRADRDANPGKMAGQLLWMAGIEVHWNEEDYPPGTEFPEQLDRGADIIVTSLNIRDNAGAVREALSTIAELGRNRKGVVTVLAAGNRYTEVGAGGYNRVARYPTVITVSATTADDRLSGLSAYGRSVDICAPSSGTKEQTEEGMPTIVTADVPGRGNLAGHPGGPLDYSDRFGGTSAAAPLVAGVAALMLSINPELSWEQVREILIRTAVKVDPDNTDPIGKWVHDADGNPLFSRWYGFGRIDAAAAVRLARDWR